MTSILKVDSIQNASGNAAISIASTGIVTNSKPVGFSAKLESTQGGVVDSTATKINHTTGGAYTFDTHNGWSNSDHHYTVPTGCDGYWQLTAFYELDVESTSTWGLISTGAAVTGSASYIARVNLTANSNHSGNPSPFVSAVVYLTAGTIIKHECRHVYGNNRNITAATTYLRTAFQGWRLF